ncbi:low choriolytic enzyme-like isoform X1 [Cololabis saira]|uniref:low choriolytic enzyme-like isoform X1 n=1 Tax=Cololabis saira TaxID=129043 RepID=UPI002AD215DB|nr:low choriolytic enzyme-like isoform X1 [Cololabis saira]
MDLTARASLLLLLLLGLCKAQPGDDPATEDVNSVVESDKDDMTTAIFKMNNGSLHLVEEGDIFIPRTRSAMKCKHKRFSCLWPKSSNGNVEIPFFISEKYDDDEKNTILLAMKGFEPKTCIRFVPRKTERAYLNIVPKYGCMSLLGFTGDKQIISLQRFGCVKNSIIQHELMHALGFYHEHTRSDRDQYVRINWDNLKQYYIKNFKKMDTNNLNTPYDYSSIMHYGRTAFGMFGRLETITPFPDPNVPIGESKTFSDIDILRINRLYKC